MGWIGPLVVGPPHLPPAAPATIRTSTTTPTSKDLRAGTAPTDPTAASAAHGGIPRLMVVSISSPRSATRQTATTASRLRAARSATLLAVRRSSYSPVRTPVLARTHAAPLSCSTSTLVRLVLYAYYT